MPATDLMMKRKAALASFVLAAVACGTSSTTPAPPVDAGPDSATPIHDAAAEGDGRVASPLCDSPGAANVDAASLPQCAHDPSIVPDASSCQAARAFVVCCGDAAVGVCISDDPTKCGSDISIGSCTSHCAENEYAVECGGGIMPAGCRSMTGPISCCPCK
jgi:hypothetical protein